MIPSINSPRTRIVKTSAGAFMPQFTCDGLNYYDVLSQVCWSLHGARLAAEAFLQPTKNPPTSGTVVTKEVKS